jgi:hypothetical protein
MQLVEVILNRIAFPPTFNSWEDEVEIESSNFDEMRRLCTDVLITAYYVLRSGYLETLANVVTTTSSNDWEVIESALFCLCAWSRGLRKSQICCECCQFWTRQPCITGW